MLLVLWRRFTARKCLSELLVEGYPERGETGRDGWRGTDRCDSVDRQGSVRSRRRMST